MQWNDCYVEVGAVFHQQHSATRRRHASDRPAPGDDAHAQQLHREGRVGQEGQGRDHRRRHARRADLRAVGQGAGAEVLVADQGQAGFLGSAADRAGSRRRQAQRVPAREPERRAHHLRQDHRGGAGAGGGAQGARADAAQRHPRRHGAARESLPTARSAIRPCASSISSRAIPRAARPSRAAIASSRRSCRCAARFSTSSARASTSSSARRKSSP